MNVSETHLASCGTLGTFTWLDPKHKPAVSSKWFLPVARIDSSARNLRAGSSAADSSEQL